jgi:hypothetical protein
MLTRQEFWREVLPPEGPYCVVGITTDKRIHSQTFHQTLLEADVAVDALDEKGINSFIGMASFHGGQNRTNANVIHLRSLFLDLDCGADDANKYPDQHAAIVALKQFVRDSKFPRPIVVNSGGGVHAYWPLTKPLARLEWKQLAEALKRTCALYGLKTDPSVTADAARVLRAVGTTNWKEAGNPRAVEVLNTAPAVDPEVFRHLMNVSGAPEEIAVPTSIGKPMDDVTKALLGNRPSSFRLILKKSVEGVGCEQILHAVTNQGEMTEPMWRAALSVAQHCKDRDTAIHRLSRNHPEYNWKDTEDKANRISGPYRCETFESNRPGGCAECPHRGKIASPIMLGKGEVEAASPEDNVVRPAQEPDKTYTIPEYPFPYVRGKHGGIYSKKEDAEGNPMDEEVYPNDFYLVNTVDDPLEGMSGLFRLHLPRDGVKEFLIPLRDITAKDTFSKRVSMQGISATGKKMESLMTYATLAVNKYQKEQRAAKSRVQFGWADNYSSFIIGDRQVTATEILHSPPSSMTLNMVKMFGKSGTLEEWKEIASFYNRPGMELHMFVLFAGFSSPLVPFALQKGGVINLYTPNAGTGKTTTLKMINSIFGHPEDMMLIKADTINARFQRIGTLQNITPTIDEITNESAEVSSDFLYHYLHARGKNRLQNHVNGERVNLTTWAANCVMTANARLEDKLYTKKRNPDGELARFLEFEYQPGNSEDKRDSDKVFSRLKTVYGTAGEVYVQYLINHLQESVDILEQMQDAVDRSAKLTQRERYWSNIAVTSLSGGMLARYAGPLDFMTDADFRRVYGWTINMLKAKREVAKETKLDPRMMLGAFLSEHINDTLVIDSGSTLKAGGIPMVPKREPRGKLYVRFEPDVGVLYLNKTKFRQFCNDAQVSYGSVVEHFTKDGSFLGEKKVRMGKGLHVSEPENVVIFKYVDKDGALDAGGNARGSGTD